MRDRELFRKLPGIEAPWRVRGIERALTETQGTQLSCPKCGKPCPAQDTRRRKWCHLDTCPYRTVIVAEVPRV